MEKNCAGCTGCTGNCQGCGGCGSSLTLTRQEVEILQVLEQIPFLPAARRADDAIPVCLEPELEGISQLPQALVLLEKKGLIDLDYREALKGFDYCRYRGYPCRGSFALTARGQQVLALLALQGIS